MINFTKIVVFVLVNMLGFFSVGIAWGIALLLGIIPTENTSISGDHLVFPFLLGTMITWLICAIFSTGYFWAPGKLRHIFLWSAAVVPLCYGLSVLVVLF